MSILPVTFSMAVTLVSPLSIMGLPSEVYVYGTPMVILDLGFVFGMIFAVCVFMPLFHVVRVNTSYQYLEERFGKFSRKLMSFLCIVNSLILSAINLYAPSLALSAVTGIPTWISCVTAGLVCTLYCTMGGMKAVLWTDVFQAILMYMCTIVVIVSGILRVGGLSELFLESYEGGRLILPTFSVDTRPRYSFWSVFFQGFIIVAAMFGTSQEQVQRVLVVKNAKQAQKAAFIALPLIISLHMMAFTCGLVLFTYFKNCDPLQEGVIHSPDQLMPYYIMSALGHIRGLPGLCVAGIFSSSLSSISSQINALAAITLEDFLMSWFNLSRNSSISKILTVFYGSLCLGLTFLVPYLGTIIEVTISVVGVFHGLSLAYYLLAAFCRKANEKGATVGVIVGFIAGAYLSISSTRNKYTPLPISNECTNETHFKAFGNFSSATSVEKDNFPVSYMWNAFIAVVVAFIVGYVVSLIINHFQGDPVVDDRFLSPVRLWFGRPQKKVTESSNNEESLQLYCQ